MSFSDVGKKANDLLSKDFPGGNTKLDVSSVAGNAKFSTVAARDHTTGAIATELKTKWSHKQGNATAAWNSANLLSLQVEHSSGPLKLDATLGVFYS